MAKEIFFRHALISLNHISVSFLLPETKMANLEIKHHSHKVGVNVHHFEWCTKYRYHMFKQDKYKKFSENVLRETASRHHMIVRELSVMPEHIHVSVEVRPSMSQSKALQLLKGNLSYKLFRESENFGLRYPKRHFFSLGGLANSTGYTTVDVVDNYVKHQEDIHQMRLSAF